MHPHALTLSIEAKELAIRISNALARSADPREVMAMCTTLTSLGNQIWEEMQRATRSSSRPHHRMEYPEDEEWKVGTIVGGRWRIDGIKANGEYWVTDMRGEDGDTGQGDVRPDVSTDAVGWASA